MLSRLFRWKMAGKAEFKKVGRPKTPPVSIVEFSESRSVTLAAYGRVKLFVTSGYAGSRRAKDAVRCQLSGRGFPCLEGWLPE